MINPLSTKNIHTDEDFKKSLKKNNLFFIGTFILGAFTMTVLFFTEHTLGIGDDSHQHTFFSGLSSALMFSSVLLFIKNLCIMSDPELLKSTRIKRTDERVLNIHSKSLAVATTILLSGVYLLYFIVGLLYPTYFQLLSKVLLSLVCLYTVTYYIAFHIYNKKM